MNLGFPVHAYDRALFKLLRRKRCAWGGGLNTVKRVVIQCCKTVCMETVYAILCITPPYALLCIHIHMLYAAN